MEFFLYFWDELDDAAALCRHLSRSVITEIVSLRTPLRAWRGWRGWRGWLRPAAQIEAH